MNLQRMWDLAQIKIMVMIQEKQNGNTNGMESPRPLETAGTLEAPPSVPTAN